ncbi:MAG: acyl-CoA dehydrogenase [Halioglobus sp.]
MDFSLTDEQRMIRETARTLFGRECTLDLVRRAWADPEAARPLWDNHLIDWLELAAQPLTDITLFMEEYGRAVVPGAYFASLLAAFVAGTVDARITGAASVAVAGPDGYWIPHGEPDWHFVLTADQAQQLVVVSGSPQAPRVAVVPAAGLAMDEVQHMDQLRRQYRVAGSALPPGQAIDPLAWEQAVRRALVAAAAELVGVGRWLLDSAVAYAQERQQFGRPIGSFQGLQWKLVDAALELERAAAAVSWAAMCEDAGDPEAKSAAHCAKLEAGSAARRCARTSLQVHGGIGYTWDHGLHFWLRRAYAGDAFMGPSDYHARCLAADLFPAGR